MSLRIKGGLVSLTLSQLIAENERLHGIIREIRMSLGLNKECPDDDPRFRESDLIQRILDGPKDDPVIQ